MRIFLFNGPPRSGKDTIVNMMVEKHGGVPEKMARLLKLAATAICCGGDAEEFARYDAPDQKDIPSDVFFGVSCRQFQIDLAEKFFKKVYGHRTFGTALAKRIILSQRDLFFISDSGFREEAEALVDAFGPDAIKLIRVYREGYTFEGDSRNYISLKDLGVQEFEIDNPEGQPEVFEQRVNEIVSQFI